MNKLFESWRKHLTEAPSGNNDIEWVDSYFKNFLSDTKKIGHIAPKHSPDDLPKWLRMGVKGIHPMDFAPSYAWDTSSFAQALEQISEENRETFKNLFLLLADAIEDKKVDASRVLNDWYKTAKSIQEN